MPVVSLGNRAVLRIWNSVCNWMGFKYVTIGFNWVKRDLKNSWFVGNGHYTMANSELCLIFRLGKTVKRQVKNVSQIVSHSLLPDDFTHPYDMFPIQAITGKGRHSAKPIAVYDALDRLYPDVTKVRLFAREERPGWYSYGNEITGNDIKIDMRTFAETEDRNEQARQ